jgi:phosphoglycolate phosphatase-like HAD superfamily hydrolase
MVLVFDFDGVVVNTLEDNRKAINAFAQKYGFTPLDVASFVTMQDSNFAEYWQHLLGERVEAFLTDLHHYPRPHPQLEESIRALLVDFSPAIVSSNTSTLIHRVLRENGVHLAVYGIDNHPSKVVKLTRLREDSPSESNVFVTDTVGDIIEGKEAGYYVIAVTWGFTKREALEKSKPHAIVDTPQELREIITKKLFEESNVALRA